MSEKKKTDIRN